MNGTYMVRAEHKRAQYHLMLKRKITIIRGDSGTGKTSLFNLIGRHQDGDVAVRIISTVKCVVISGRDWYTAMDQYSNCVIFIDEASKFISTTEFARAIKYSDNYFVIISRYDYPTLAYSIDEIYNMSRRGTRFFTTPAFKRSHDSFKPTVVLTEDERSGNQFFMNLTKNTSIQCKSTGDGNNGFTKIIKAGKYKSERIMLCIDAVAFGSYYNELQLAIMMYGDISEFYIFAPECFEALILTSGMFAQLPEALDRIMHPENYINYLCDKNPVVSWEIYYYDLLRELTKDTPASYNKSKLDTCFLHDCCCKEKERVKSECGICVYGDKTRIILGEYADKLDFCSHSDDDRFPPSSAF